MKSWRRVKVWEDENEDGSWKTGRTEKRRRVKSGRTETRMGVKIWEDTKKQGR